MNDKITCPNCSHKFDVEEALSSQLRDQFQREFQQKVEKQNDYIRKQKQEIELREEEFERKREKANEEFKERLNKKIVEEKRRIEKEFQDNANAELLSLREENNKNKEKLKAANNKELELLKREKALQDYKEEIELQLEKKMLEESKKYENKGREKERMANELREKEYQKQLEDQKKLIEEMKRKADQGSMQLQGEVQELLIEEYLKKVYPLDFINEVKKGAFGADCIQTINTRELKECGKISYESKRTKAFNYDWISKLKTDMQRSKSDIGIIVTQTRPKELNSLGSLDGIWICSLEEFPSLSLVLRDSMIRLKKLSIINEGKTDKMSLLYDYLTSQEFRMNIEAIVESFTMMKSQLLKEKQKMNSYWNEREKQIEKVILNTTSMYGSIRGIAGKAVPTIDVLELDDDEQQQLDF